MAFNYWSNTTTRNALPLVVAGPILRKVTSSSVTVWIAFRGVIQTPVLNVSDPATGFVLFSSDSALSTGANAYITHIGNELNIAMPLPILYAIMTRGRIHLIVWLLPTTAEALH